MTTENSKYKTSETIIVKRSKINFSPYNPKRHTKEQIDQIKRNLKKVGFLGGIIWNSQTGNLIDGHKRVSALDIINKFDGTPETDYEIKVERIDLDLQTEKEQNIFQTRSRTDFDDELMRELIKDIDFKNAGLDEFDLNYYGVSIPEIENTSIADDIEAMYQPIAQQNEIEREAKKEAVKEAKKEIQEKAIEKAKNMTAYITLSFDNYKNKAAFCQRFDIIEDATIIKGEEFSENVERTY